MAKKAKVEETHEDDELPPPPKKKRKVEEDEDEPVALVNKKTKKELTKAQLLSAALRKEHGNEFCSTIEIDPNVSLKRAVNGYVPMPDWFEMLTGVEGIPYGHISLIQGKPDCGKTTSAMVAMVNAQKKGDYVVLVDTEYKFNWERFQSMGGQVDDVVHIEGSSVEEAFRKIDATKEKILKLDKEAYVLIVWDSLGMTPTESELAGNKDQATAARVIKKGLRVRMSQLHKKRVALLIVNHVYAKMNVMFGDATTGYGGDGAYFAAVLVIEVKKGLPKEKVKNGMKYTAALGSKMKVKKNHIGTHQGRTIQVEIYPDRIEATDDLKKKMSMQKADDLAGELDSEEEDEFENDEE